MPKSGRKKCYVYVLASNAPSSYCWVAKKIVFYLLIQSSHTCHDSFGPIINCPNIYFPSFSSSFFLCGPSSYLSLFPSHRHVNVFDWKILEWKWIFVHGDCWSEWLINELVGVIWNVKKCCSQILMKGLVARFMIDLPSNRFNAIFLVTSRQQKLVVRIYALSVVKNWFSRTSFIEEASEMIRVW